MILTRIHRPFYFKDGESLHEEFLDSLRPSCFINGSQICLSEKRNILGILIT